MSVLTVSERGRFGDADQSWNPGAASEHVGEALRLCGRHRLPPLALLHQQALHGVAHLAHLLMSAMISVSSSISAIGLSK
jgi:hypothetical protein